MGSLSPFRRKWLFAAIAVVTCAAIVAVFLRASRWAPSPVQSRAETGRSETVRPKEFQPRGGNSIPVALRRARALVKDLREFATQTNNVPTLVYRNAAALAQLRALGADGITAALEAIADKTAPEALRILLIEIVVPLASHDDDRAGRVLLAIIGDSSDMKSVRMQALQWIPATSAPQAGAVLVKMLPGQSDPDLEFGITRALERMRVPGSVSILRSELSEGKPYLVQIAAYHAIANQGKPTALALLQASVADRLRNGSEESRPEENAVSIHGILALGEISDTSSLPTLEAVATNPANSVSVRNTAIQTIATIGGRDAREFIRHSLRTEQNSSILVYVARAVAVLGSAQDAAVCDERAADLTDDYVKSELQKAAKQLRSK